MEEGGSVPYPGSFRLFSISGFGELKVTAEPLHVSGESALRASRTVAGNEATCRRTVEKPRGLVEEFARLLPVGCRADLLDGRSEAGPHCFISDTAPLALTEPLRC